MSDRYLSEWDFAEEPTVESVPVEDLAHDLAVSVLIEESSFHELSKRYPEASTTTLLKVGMEIDKIIEAVIQHDAERFPKSSTPTSPLFDEVQHLPKPYSFDVGDTVVHTDGRIGYVWSKLPNNSDTYRVQFDSEDGKVYAHASALRPGRR